MPAIAVTSASNGIATPLSPSPGLSNATATTKRKRASTSEEAPNANGAQDSVLIPDRTAPPVMDPSLSDVLSDMLAVLKNYDTSPSILAFNLDNSAARSANSAEPTAKRTKFSQSSSIMEKLKAAEYTDFDALVKDVDMVATALLAPIKSKDGNVPSTPYGRPSMLAKHESVLLHGVIAFQKVLADMVHAEDQRALSKKSIKTPAKEQSSTNGITVKMETEEGGMLENGGSVLTLFANAPGPKQLFSSFQQPSHVNASGVPKQLEMPIDVIVPLRESGIPSFIGTTNIPNLETEDSKRGKDSPPKIGDLFAPPANLPRLQPPKPSKQMVAKGNNITFVPHDRLARTERRNSYNWCAAKQAVGQWLSYGGVDVPLEPTSPQAKRKQRDRALSTGEAYLVPSESEKIALKKAQEDALFRKVYGSFAPTHDDTGVVVPEGTKNEIWWNKLSERFAQSTLLIDPALLGEVEANAAVEGAKEAEEETFKDAVDSFDPEKLGLDKFKAEKAEEEVEGILQEISDLLETLSSYQRIRNSSLAATARTTVGQNSPLQEMMGSPSNPSTAEVEVYKTLKAQLSVLVLSLPPYAVARLNGDQLEELSIKASIIVETENARGVMAEDEASRNAKQQAFATAAGPPQPSRASSGSAYQNYSGSQYNRTPVAPASVRSGAPQSYLPQQQNSNRATPLQYQRSSSGVQTFSGGYPTTAPRPTYPQQGYNQSTSRPSYQPPSNQYYSSLQQVAGGTRQGGYSQTTQQYQGTPHTQNRNNKSTPSSTYQQRPQNQLPHYNYPTSQSPQIRTASPLTAAGAAAPAPQYNQSRPAYSTPATATANRSSYYQPPASQPGQYASTPGTVGPSGFHSTMSASEQQSMLNRIQQQQARMSAPSASSGLSPARQSSGSGTPQPPRPSTNGSQSMVAQPS